MSQSCPVSEVTVSGSRGMEMQGAPEWYRQRPRLVYAARQVMRFIYFDVDTLRRDHLSCYGYIRKTTPYLDEVAAGGIRFDQVFVSDSPCLPSRTALVTGRFGIANGVVNHGGTRAELFSVDAGRARQSDLAISSWPHLLRKGGLWCTSISTFAERHSAYHWYAGFNEVLNLGRDGHETAEEVSPLAIDWLRRNGKRDNWFLHVHLWDAHTPYRTPARFGDPFTGQPGPTWLDEDVLANHWRLAGPHSAQEVLGFEPDERFTSYPRQPQQIRTVDDVRRMFDGYDTSVHFADAHVGRIISVLEELGISDETAIMASSDHGETLGELGIYCDHQTADLHTHGVPMILRWPGLSSGRADTGLRYQIDVAATVADLLGVAPPAEWDGVSFAPELLGKTGPARDHLVLSCGAWTTQRAVRFDRWLYIRTYHDAFHGFPPTMLFDVENDPHEQHDLATNCPSIVDRAATLLLDWEADQMSRSRSGTDPLWAVIVEGGGYYTRVHLESYLSRLKATGRAERAEQISAAHVVP